MSDDATQALTSCTACGTAFPAGARFCPSCGVALEPSLRQVAAERTPVSTNDPLIGRVIASRYRILSQLGRGGMGVVYRVEHVHIGKLMAMKLLSGELAGDPMMLRRFQREAQAVSLLSHPNTVQIFDFGESDELAYLVMEYLPGRDLATVIHDAGALPFDRLAKMAVQIAGSVEEAHQRGIIHRDIKPENVMVLDTSEREDFIKVLDFGIAKLRGRVDGVPATQRGHLVGTPYYMAPEQIRGDPIDARVDVYALGALMYKAVTGEMPYHAERPMEVLTKHLNEPLVPPRERAPLRNIPIEGERIIARALAKDRDHRQSSMAELRSELLGFLASRGVEAPKPSAKLRTELVATRGDVDRYETRIRRTRGLGLGGSLLVLSLAAGTTYVLWRRPGRTAASGEEREPNDLPRDAQLLAAGVPLTGHIGKRISKTESDADLFRLAPEGEARVANIAVTALPNVDLMLDVAEQGATLPFLTVDSGGVGEPERIPNLTLAGEAYFLRVRGKVKPGEYPVENVSDSYVATLAWSAPTANGEHEPNDAFERAETLAAGPARTGLIGWAEDRDVYCERGTARRDVELSGVPGLDLTLAVVDRRTNAGQRIDRNGVGEGERAEIAASKVEREVCVTVSAREREGAKQLSDQPYELVLR